jgi:septal ring factor EnvC (AmiA/AmiB activator)
VNIDVNGHKQSPPAGHESPAGPPVALAEALPAMLSDLLAACEQAARPLRERAKVDVEALRRPATEDDVARSREQLPQLEASVSQLTALLKELRADVDQLRAELRPGGDHEASSSAPDAANGAPQFDRRALLIALNMASNGASQSEAADYLAANLNLRDCDELLDEVYRYVASMRTGPREVKPAP